MRDVEILPQTARSEFQADTEALIAIDLLLIPKDGVGEGWVERLQRPQLIIF